MMTLNRIQEYFLFQRRNKVDNEVNNLNQNQENFDPLKWFNRLSCLFGLSFNSRDHGRFFKFYNKFYGFLVWIYAVYHVLKFLVLMTRFPSLAKLDTIMYYFSQIIYILVIHVWSNRLSKFFNSLSSDLTLKQKKIIHWISIICWIPLLIQRIAFTFVRFFFGGNFFDNILIIKLAKSLHVSHIIHAFVLHLIFLVSCYFSCLKELREINDSVDPINITKTLNKIEKQLKEVNRIAGLPFLILLPYLFINFPAYSFVRNFNREFHVLIVYCMIMNCSFLLINAFTAIVLKEKLESKRMTVIEKLMSSNESKLPTSIEWNICITRLFDDKLFDFTVFSLFKINFSFLMSFASALITYSILFFQIDSNTQTNQS